MAVKCPVEGCNKTFTRTSNLKRHEKNFHSSDQVVEKCFLCKQIFQSCEELKNHYETNHLPSEKFEVLQSAFKKTIVTYRYTYPETCKNFAIAQSTLLSKIQNVILCEAAQKNVCKVALVLVAQMSMTDHVGQRVTIASIPFRASNFLANASMPGSVKKNIIRSFNQQAAHLDEFIQSGSNWQFDRALVHDIEIAALRPVVSGSEKVFVSDAEKQINISNFKNNKYLFNPMNEDMKCFLFCLAYFLFGQKLDKKSKKPDCMQLKKYFSNFNVEGITFPISINGIKKFLKRNHHLDLKINILIRTKDVNKKEQIFPYEYGLGNGTKIVNLLMIQNQITADQAVNHFLLITDVNKYLRRCYRNEKKGKKSYQNAFYCLNCLNYFSSQNILDEHDRICSMNKPRQELMPDEDRTEIYFKNFEKQHKLDYIAYLDFECVLPPEKRRCEFCCSLKCKCDASFTDILSKQEAIGYSFVVLNKHNKIVHENTYIGEKAAEVFIEHLLKQENNWIKNLLSNNNPMVMSELDQIDFNNATCCYICDEDFTEKNYKCRDHNHLTSEYLGAACNKCNLRRRKPSTLKIFVHNGSRYDFHFLVSAISQFPEEIHSIRILPFNGENFRTISFNCFEFIDSLAFLQASLSELCSDLKDSGHNYEILKQTYLVKTNGKFDAKKYKMLLEKSFFPYEFCTSLKQMENVTELPDIKHFKSSLTEKTISKSDHKFAKKVWKIFNCKNLLDYSKVYNKIDTILLAEVFQKFRNDMHRFSGLDPAHYISLPSYSYDSMLKLTGSVISLPTDINMVQFLEAGKRGGVAFIGTRELKPSSQPDDQSEIVYLDANVRINFFT
jgi:hypothetical protein